MEASGAGVFDGDLQLVHGSAGSDVESLMCLLRSQVKQAGVNTLITAAGHDAASGGAVQADVIGAGVAQAAAAAAVEDAAECDGGVEPQSLQVCPFKFDTRSVCRPLASHVLFSFSGAYATTCECIRARGRRCGVALAGSACARRF